VAAALFVLAALALPLAGQEEPAPPEGPGASGRTESEEPALPEGLGASRPAKTEEPALPPGLGPVQESAARAPEGVEEPPLPAGLGEKPPAAGEEEAGGSRLRLPAGLNGFWELRAGARTQEDEYEKDGSIGETRLQLEYERSRAGTSVKATADFLYDRVAEEHEIDLEEGEGWFDLREASISATPVDFMDIKLGRQILTWGTGDFLFLNDLFPKDWNSFFIGRDDEYLKAPSDAVKASFFSDAANLDVVYTPRVDADRFIDGRRISYWNGGLGRRAGRDAPVDAARPDDWFQDDEAAVRLFRNIRGWELALYGYKGFWKSPGGTDPVSGKATFPELAVFGASVRGAVGKGIGNAEVAYYDSEEDGDGDDPLVRNSELRLLVGYEQEVAKDFTAGVQYYLEHMMDHDEYERSLPAGSPAADENRSVFTLRLTKLLMSQNLKLSLFTFYSPTDEDAYLRPKAHYKIDDHWSVEAGGNVFLGEEEHTFFGQFEDNTNVYAATRYGF